MRSSTIITLICVPIGYWIPTLFGWSSVETALTLTIGAFTAVGLLRFNERSEARNDGRNHN